MDLWPRIVGAPQFDVLGVYQMSEVIRAVETESFFLPDQDKLVKTRVHSDLFLEGLFELIFPRVGLI